jgi:hypothetical protein
MNVDEQEQTKLWVTLFVQTGWWWEHKAVLGSFILVLASLLTMAFPLFAQRRLPKVSLAEIIRLYPHLRWLRWGGPLMSWGSWLLLLPLFLYLHNHSRRLSDEQGLFLLAVMFCIPSLSAAVLAMVTGIYREIVGRGEPAGKYYCVAETELSWVPWAQSLAALTVVGLSLGGFFAMATR